MYVTCDHSFALDIEGHLVEAVLNVLCTCSLKAWKAYDL